MTNDIDQKGFCVSTKHTLTTMKFYDVDNFRMEGFNHQNAIFGLGIEQKTRAEGPRPYFAVEKAVSNGWNFWQIFGKSLFWSRAPGR
jgi:hypothetical protein